MPILKVENLSTGYGKKQVLFNVNFEVNTGDIVLVAGSNGSGKSTLLKAIYGMLPQWDNGRVKFDGEDITGLPTAALLKRGLLYIPQKNNLFEDLTVKENLEMAGLSLNKELLKNRIEYVLSLFTGLSRLLRHTPMKLSGGERQLLSLSMATLHQPKMILFDEPFIGLSPNNICFISEKLMELHKKNVTTLFLAEHRIKESLLFVTKIIGLKIGYLVAGYDIENNFSTKILEELFI